MGESLTRISVFSLSIVANFMCDFETTSDTYFCICKMGNLYERKQILKFVFIFSIYI